MNQELSDVQAGLRKGRGIRDQIANICWIIERAREIQKNIYSASLTTLKPLTVWITKNCEILKKMGIPDYLTCLLSNLYAVQEATVGTGHRTTGFSGKEDDKAACCHPAYLTVTQSTSCKMPGWMNHKLESRLPREILITSDAPMTPPLWQKAKKNQSERGK